MCNILDRTTIGPVVFTEMFTETIRDVVESQKCLHEFHLKMYLLILSLCPNSASAFCQSFPEGRAVRSRLVYCNVYVQTGYSLTHPLKRVPDPITQKGFGLLLTSTGDCFSADHLLYSSIQGFVCCQQIWDSYATETTNNPYRKNPPD